jgi:hypothetical protein
VKLILDLEELLLVVLSDEVDGETKVSETARPTDSVEVGLGVAREVKVDDNIN